MERVGQRINYFVSITVLDENGFGGETFVFDFVFLEDQHGLADATDQTSYLLLGEGFSTEGSLVYFLSQSFSWILP